MNHTLKAVFSTTAQAKAAERIARAYKTKTISFLDKSHQNSADWQRLETYVDKKVTEMNRLGAVEAMARGNFHERRVEDPPGELARLTIWLLNGLGIPLKSVHVNQDGSESSIRDISEKDQAKGAAKIAESKAAAAEAAAAQIKAKKSSTT